MALKTESLSPAHTYVPWTVVNGIHDKNIEKKIEKSLLQYVCDNFKGTKSKDCPPPTTSMSFAFLSEPESTI